MRVNRFRTTAGCLLVGALLSACGQGSEAATDPEELLDITLTVQTGTGVTPLIEVADQEDIFADNGLEASLIEVQNGPAAATALAAGDVDVATNAAEVFLPLALSGEEIVLVSGQVRVPIVLMARPGLEVPADFPASVQAIEGQTVGVTALSSTTHYLVQALLESVGLDPDAAAYTATGTSAAGLQALSAGQVDVAVLTGSSIPQAQELGATMVVDLRTEDTCPADFALCGVIDGVGMWARASWVEENAETVDRLRRAMADADLFIRDDDNVDIVRDLLVPNAAELDADSVDAYLPPTIEGISAGYSQDALAARVEFDVDYGIIEQTIPVEDIYAEGTPQGRDDVEALAGS